MKKLIIADNHACSWVQANSTQMKSWSKPFLLRAQKW